MMRNKRQFLVAATLVVVGSNILTYAVTRQRTTERVLTRSWDIIEQFLVERNLAYGQSNYDVDIPSDVQIEGKTLLGDVSLVGGLHHWWNGSLPYLGLGVFLVLVGLLVPFVAPRPEVDSEDQS